MRVSRCARVLMTATSRPSRVSAIAAAKPSLSLSSRSVRSASRCRQSSSAGDARARAELFDARPARGERVLRNIDAVEIAIVVLAVLQMIDDLQRGAQRVVGRPDRAALAMDVADEAADRHGRERAIRDQIVPVAIAQLGDVELERGDQILGVLRRQPALGEHGAQPHRDRIVGRWRRSSRLRAGRADAASRPAAASHDRRCRRRCGRNCRTPGSRRDSADE